MELWNKNQELLFFNTSRSFASVDQLFNRTEDGRLLLIGQKTIVEKNLHCRLEIH